MKKIFTLFVIVAAFISANAQESGEYQHRYVGIGIRASVFQISELPISIIPANRLLVNIDPIKYARVEFHFAGYTHSDEMTMLSTPPLILKEKSSLLGFGVFGTYPCGKAKFIAGMRYSRNKYAMDDILFDSFGNPYTAEDHGTITIISPVIGGEYYFSKWFSIGAEFGYMLMNDEYDPADPGAPSTTSSTTITESSLIFRFYPY